MSGRNEMNGWEEGSVKGRREQDGYERKHEVTMGSTLQGM